MFGIRIEVAGVTLYHQGSADLDDGELRDEPVDVFLAGVAGRGVTPRYWERILPKLDGTFEASQTGGRRPWSDWAR